MTWLIIGAIIVVVDTLFAIVLISILVRNGWNELPRRFPAREPAPDAVRRDFQSFKLGLLNLGRCVHVAVDERHLHLTPVKLLRLFGAEAASIPWSAMEIRRRSSNAGFTTVAIGNQQLLGPAWCLDLAEPAADG